MNQHIEEALNRIKIASSGLATGKLNNRIDKDFAKEILENLYRTGVILDSNEIYDWAIQNKWVHEDALKLTDLAEDIMGL